MSDNSIAMLSVGSDNALLAEIGAKNPGMLILFKKSGLYFTGGLDFANRTGEVFVGSSGPKGKSFHWRPGERSRYCLSDFMELTVENTGYERLESYESVYGKYSFETENGTLTVMGGVNAVSVCASVVIRSAARGNKSVAVFKNGEKTPVEIEQTVNKGGCATLTLAPVVISVAEGDTLDLRVRAGKGDKIGLKTLSVEALS